MPNNQLNTKEIFTGIRKEFWQDLAIKIKNMIREDMVGGKVQLYTAQERPTSGGAMHYSKGYKDAKGRYFNRLKDGKKYKSVAGKSVVDNTTTSVNLRRTGKTIEGLHLESVILNGIIMSYEGADEDKIIYNEEMGRWITTLNEKNKGKVLNLFADELDKSLQTWCKKTVVINT